MPVQMGALMQEGWGRRYALLELDTETLTQMLEPVAPGHAIDPTGGAYRRRPRQHQLPRNALGVDRYVDRAPLYSRSLGVPPRARYLPAGTPAECRWRKCSTPIQTASAADVRIW